MSRGVKSQACAPSRWYVKMVRWVALLTTFVWVTVGAEGTVSQTLEKHVTVSFRTAPVSVFMSALFANSGLGFKIEDGVDVTVSGDYTGTIEDVLERVSASLSLSVEYDQSTVRISNNPIEVAPAKNTTIKLTPTLVPAPDSAPEPQTTELVLSLLEDKAIPRKNLQTPTQRIGDEFVERLFLLKNVAVADKVLSDSLQTVIPGAVSQLKRLMSNLGVQDFEYRGAAARSEPEGSVSIVALASMNAIMVRDRASRMALYRDLIDSIDSSAIAASSKFSKKKDDAPKPMWSAVK